MNAFISTAIAFVLALVTADTKETTVSGRVLNPAGKPVAGAELLLLGEKKPLQKAGSTDAEGRFTVAAPRGERGASLVTRAPGFGIDFIDLGSLKGAEKVTLRLVKDHAIRGRVIDTEGKPVRGATVSVKRVRCEAGNSLDSFLVAWKKNNQTPAYFGVPLGDKDVRGDSVLPATTTDKDGRFTVSGVGIERVALLRIRGLGIADGEYFVVNRLGFDPRLYNKVSPEALAMIPGGVLLRLWGPDLSVVAEAEKLIRGVVKDHQTGKPRAGVSLTLARNGEAQVPIYLSATTDAHGHYEIHGARKSSRGYVVEVSSDSAIGYMASLGRSPDTPGYSPVTIDIHSRKGVVVTGRVIDQATGMGLPGIVYVDVLLGNAFAKEYPHFNLSGPFNREYTAGDGTFRIVTLPGPVILMGGPDTQRMPEGEIAFFRYRAVAADPRYPKYFPAVSGAFAGRCYLTHNGGPSPLRGAFAKVLDIKPDAGTVKQDIVLQRASALPVTIVSSTGRPVRGTWVTGMSPQDWWAPIQLTEAACNVYHLEPGKPRLLVVYDPAGKQFGTLRLKGNEKKAAVVKLRRGGTVTGRLIDEKGRPLSGVDVTLRYRERTAEEMRAHVHGAKLFVTGADGKFTINDVVPGATFGMYYSWGKWKSGVNREESRSVQSGKTLDQGDIVVRIENLR
jgi:protocatechuate 3,4-dioxygenase beta subunit/5-hydroxyisourate hydrolase-like protein (transthyretin family)